jgi:hypothetical protein
VFINGLNILAAATPVSSTLSQPLVLDSELIDNVCLEQ